MRFAIYVALLLSILPFVLLRPFFGLCVYYVVSLLQPKYIAWHPAFQDAMIVGVPLVVGAILIGVKRRELIPQREVLTGRPVGVRERIVQGTMFEPAWPLAVCALLLVYISVTRLLVPYPLENNADLYRALIKIMFVTALVTGMASDHRRLRILYIVVALSTAFWAIKGGLKMLVLGPHQIYGKNYDNNFFALTSVMTLPMVFYFALSVRSARWRNLLMVCSALICLGIIGSHSRAGFVAFAFVMMGMAWTYCHRVRALAAVVFVVIVTTIATGPEIRERIDSIFNYREDNSARSRFATWAVAGDLLWQSPVIGVGFNNFELARREFDGGRKAAHNIYLQNLAELGLLGHPLWLLLVFGSLFSMYRFMRWSRRLPVDLRWAHYWSRGLFLGMCAFCIHGLFHNEEYLELMFAMVGLHMALKIATRRELQSRKLLSTVQPARRTRRRGETPAPRPRALHPAHLFPA
ncbi:MAG: hypothetical protein DCC65_02320 [Planctomycetota bacterium]|nr:MAG: hypothetical protein DCC65_02320 [Planctomycetota bacterium]